jgi:hypothetical protein
MGKVMTKEEAIKAFEERKKKAKEEGQIDNGSLRAGSPMYFYCKGCGIHHATLPESYITPPPAFCKDCRAMKDAGLVVSG